MRNQLLDLYNTAIETKDKDAIRAFQSARDAVGPNVVMDEILRVNELEKRLAEMKDAIRKTQPPDAKGSIPTDGFMMIPVDIYNELIEVLNKE
jgi:hypothetical protein